MQLVMDCNTMAEELEKPVEFKTKLLSAQARGQDTGRTEVKYQFDHLLVITAQSDE